MQLPISSNFSIFSNNKSDKINKYSQTFSHNNKDIEIFISNVFIFFLISPVHGLVGLASAKTTCIVRVGQGKGGGENVQTRQNLQ